MGTVYILVGSPGVGKSWVSSHLKNSFNVCEHDDFKDNKRYVTVLAGLARTSEKPILANTPFGLSELKKDLEARGVSVEPVFIIEPEEVIKSRYEARERRPIPPGHLTRQNTYIQRAKELNAFQGTSLQVLQYLEGKAK